MQWKIVYETLVNIIAFNRASKEVCLSSFGLGFDLGLGLGLDLGLCFLVWFLVWSVATWSTCRSIFLFN